MRGPGTSICEQTFSGAQAVLDRCPEVVIDDTEILGLSDLPLLWWPPAIRATSGRRILNPLPAIEDEVSNVLLILKYQENRVGPPQTPVLLGIKVLRYGLFAVTFSEVLKDASNNRRLGRIYLDPVADRFRSPLRSSGSDGLEPCTGSERYPQVRPPVA